MDTKELSERAVNLYEKIRDLTVWEKRDVTAILHTLVELDVRREVGPSKTIKTA